MDKTHSQLDQIFDAAGYIPGVSIGTGCTRAARGVGSLVDAAISRSGHSAQDGLYQIGRGLTEAIPIIGNAAWFFVDLHNGVIDQARPSAGNFYVGGNRIWASTSLRRDYNHTPASTD